MLLSLGGRGGVQEINGENLEGGRVSIHGRNAVLNDESVCRGRIRSSGSRSAVAMLCPVPLFQSSNFDDQSDPDSTFHHSCALQRRLPSCLIYLEDSVSCESRDA